MNITNIINNDESVKETSIPKDIKEQLKNLSIDERYNLLNTINREERNEYIRSWGLSEMRLFVKLFSFTHRIEIGKIKLVKDE